MFVRTDLERTPSSVLKLAILRWILGVMCQVNGILSAQISRCPHKPRDVRTNQGMSAQTKGCPHKHGSGGSGDDGGDGGDGDECE
jgi:hypothetical protein